MAEKRVLEDYVLSGVMHVRHQHEYPTVFRMVAGAYHAFNAVANGIGGGMLILSQDTVIEEAQRRGAGIQASSALGQGVLFLGAGAVVLALLYAWAAWSFLRARQQSYWFLVLFNGLSCVFLVFVSLPTSLLQWVQLVCTGLIAFLLLFDARVKAFYHRGPLAAAWWEEEDARVTRAWKETKPHA